MLSYCVDLHYFSHSHFHAKVSDIFENESSNLKNLLFCVPASSVSTVISAFLINPEYLP